MVYLIATLHVVICFFLIIVVLLQAVTAVSRRSVGRNGLSNGTRPAWNGYPSLQGDYHRCGSFYGHVACSGNPREQPQPEYWECFRAPPGASCPEEQSYPVTASKFAHKEAVIRIAEMAELADALA